MIRQSPSLSIVIATYNRPRSLVRLLDRINHQKRIDLRMIDVCVVDDGSDIDLSGLFPKYNFLFRYIYRSRHPDNFPRVYSSRNLSARSTMGEVVLQLDDDLEFHERTLSEIQNYAQLFKILSPEEMWLWSPRLSNTTDIEFGDTEYNRGIDGSWNDGKACWRKENWGGCTSAGMTMPRYLWDSIGGYDEEFDGTMGFADGDLALRATKAGAGIYGAPIFFHINDSETGSWRESMIQSSGRSNEPLFNLRHPDKDNYK